LPPQYRIFLNIPFDRPVSFDPITCRPGAGGCRSHEKYGPFSEDGIDLPSSILSRFPSDRKTVWRRRRKIFQIDALVCAQWNGQGCNVQSYRNTEDSQFCRPAYLERKIIQATHHDKSSRPVAT
jgi:hypothetical protein